MGNDFEVMDGGKRCGVDVQAYTNTSCSSSSSPNFLNNVWLSELENTGSSVPTDAIFESWKPSQIEITSYFSDMEKRIQAENNYFSDMEKRIQSENAHVDSTTCSDRFQDVS